MNKLSAVSDPFDPRYQQTRFYMTDPIPQGWLQFAIITAHNPGGQCCDEITNCRAHIRLQNAVSQRGIEHIEITGSAPDDTHQERGFGLLCSVVEATNLAGAFNQLAFYWVDSGHLYLVDTARGEQVNLGEMACRVHHPKGNSNL